MIYLDNAATTYPKPSAVAKAAADAVRIHGGNPGRSGHFLSLRTGEKVYAVRTTAARFFHTAPECAIFTKNCTEAVNLAVHGALQTGDHVILSDLEHNAVYRPIWLLAKEGHIHFDLAKTGDTDEETLEAFRQKIRPETKMILCTHASNVTGRVLPIRALGALCREKGLLFLVDAAQSAGVLPLDLAADQITFLCVAGHKGLYGPTGTGLLLLREATPLRPLMQGGTGSVSIQPDQPDFYPDRLESGTINTVGILGLGAGLRTVTTRGIQNIHRHEEHLCQILLEGLSTVPGIRLYRTEGCAYAPIVAFNLGDRPANEVVQQLSDRGFCLRGGLHCAPLAHQKLGTTEQGVVRASPGMFNTEAQIRALVQEMRRAAIK